jgi:hypothetical protein
MELMRLWHMCDKKPLWERSFVVCVTRIFDMPRGIKMVDIWRWGIKGVEWSGFHGEVMPSNSILDSRLSWTLDYVCNNNWLIAIIIIFIIIIFILFSIFIWNSCYWKLEAAVYSFFNNHWTTFLHPKQGHKWIVEVGS